MPVKKVVFFLCMLLVESKSVFKSTDSEQSHTSDQTTIRTPEGLVTTSNTPPASQERDKRYVLEPWIIYDSAEKELFKRSAEERDWYTNYEAVRDNLLLSFLRSKRSLQTGKVDVKRDLKNNVAEMKALKEKVSSESKNVHRRSIDTYTGGIVFDPYMGRF